MSYAISLLDPETKGEIYFDEPHRLNRHTTDEFMSYDANFGITYNYASHYYRTMGELGIRTIYGKTGEESVPILRKAIDALGDDVSRNYWDSTEGNAKMALLTLLEFAETRPDGIWDGD